MKIIWGLFFTMFLLCNLIVQGLVWTLPLPPEDEVNEIECYDRYDNEIKDLICEEVIVGYSTSLKLGLSIMVLVLSFLLSLVSSNLGDGI